MADFDLPVRPNLNQLKHQAKDLLREIKKDRPSARLAEAQFALARRYGLPNWPRLVLACGMTDAIWRDDADAVRKLVLKNPELLHQMARGTETCNWGPPMMYAANLGRDRIISMLREIGAKDVEWAFGRAALQGQVRTAKLLYAMGARPPRDAVMGPAEALNGTGMAYMLDLGAEIGDGDGNRLAPVAMVLETYTRNPLGKHECLELLVKHGLELPDTPAMAVHRGRIDLLDEHLRREPGLLTRTYRHEEIYPPELACHADESLALHGTPLSGATLLHMCVDYDEMDIARCLLERGMNVDVRADIDSEGFGAHTALFGCVVSYPHLNGRQRDAAFARLLLDRGADPNARASLRKLVRFSEDESIHDYRDITPLAWGQRFHARQLVSEPAMRLIAERGGHP